MTEGENHIIGGHHTACVKVPGNVDDRFPTDDAKLAAVESANTEFEKHGLANPDATMVGGEQFHGFLVLRDRIAIPQETLQQVSNALGGEVLFQNYTSVDKPSVYESPELKDEWESVKAALSGPAKTQILPLLTFEKIDISIASSGDQAAATALAEYNRIYGERVEAARKQILPILNS